MVGVETVLEGGLVEEKVQLACMEINNIQQIYGEVEDRRDRNSERCSCPQVVQSRQNGAFPWEGESRRGSGLLVDHIQERKD